MKKSLLLILAAVLLTQVASALPSRIISGIPSATEMLFALGLSNEVVGVTTNCNYPPAAAGKEKVGGFFLNLEKVESLKPDLIVMVEDAQKRDVERFRNFGLPVYTINPRTVAGVLDSLTRLGEVTGATAEAALLVEQLKTRIASVEPPVDYLTLNLVKPRVLVIVGYQPLIVAGGGTFIDDVIKRAGAENAAANTRAAYPQYSLERLLKDNPEYIIIPAGVMKPGELKGLSAKVLYIDADVLSRPGPRVVEAIEQIAGFIHGKKT